MNGSDYVGITGMWIKDIKNNYAGFERRRPIQVDTGYETIEATNCKELLEVCQKEYSTADVDYVEVSNHGVGGSAYYLVFNGEKCPSSIKSK